MVWHWKLRRRSASHPPGLSPLCVGSCRVAVLAAVSVSFTYPPKCGHSLGSELG